MGADVNLRSLLPPDGERSNIEQLAGGGAVGPAGHVQDPESPLRNRQQRRLAGVDRRARRSRLEAGLEKAIMAAKPPAKRKFNSRPKNNSMTPMAPLIMTMIFLLSSNAVINYYLILHSRGDPSMPVRIFL